MQFEDFDKRIKEAADHHHPAYNNTAWEKMEELLDKHLPEKKSDRRRFLFLLLFPLLIGGGAWLLISKPWADNEIMAKIEKKTTPNDPAGTVEQVPSKSSIIEDPAGSQPSPNGSQIEQVKGNAGIPNSTISSVPGQNVQPKGAEMGGINDFEVNITSPGRNKKSSKSPTQPAVEDQAEKPGKVVIVESKIDPQDEKKVTEQKAFPIAPVTIEENKTIQKENVPLTQVNSDPEKQGTKKLTTKKSNSFFFSLSAGPDVSSVGDEGTGKVKLLGGIGIGYTFKDRLTLRTGFYVANKIYTADKDYYKPAVTPPNFFYLDNVDADCKVYEIPLSLTYHFGKSTKHNFFASAGLSSYLMKEEVYDYNYKYPGNPPVTYTHTYSFSNENNHFFSVVGLSGGYQRNISKVVSIMAEPYLKIPLAGVGNGNVKLKSGGILFSVTVKPFQGNGSNGLVKKK